jgi:putative nucleotidyltransferase with HDIG domain
MPRRVSQYVALIATAALTSGVALYIADRVVGVDSIRSLFLLSFLAIVAEMLALVLPNSARGSIAFIPYLATAIISPNWAALLAIAIVKTTVEILQRPERRAAVFNVVAHVLTLSAAIWSYKALGGVSLLTLSGASFLHTSVRAGPAALLAFAASFLLNGLVVCYFLALRAEKAWGAVWRQSVFPTIGMDLVAGPVVFIFAWLCVAHGPIAAAALWVPILGLREVHKANLELQRTNQELLQLMVKSIEARDTYTSGHSRRVQHYSTVIARFLGLGEREVERIGRAALLHDVGKIYEKYGPILRKADKLTPDEWATMQEHPIDGANLVATMSGLKDVVAAIRHHHENWDGTGYPDGLRGEAIPLDSRIITFADTIDAMTSERPYRQPLSEAQVRSEIIRCRGRQFDPTIADRVIASGLWRSLLQPPAREASAERGLVLVGSRKGLKETA